MTSKTTDIESLFEHLFLKAGDLGGKDFTLTIEKVQREIANTKQGKEMAVIIYFKELKSKIVQLPDTVTGKMVDVAMDPKKLWCNKTNGRSIKALYGPIEQWEGKRITIYPTTTRGAGGATVECIRVRNVAPPEKDGAKQ
jgi:hypothetical protein